MNFLQLADEVTLRLGTASDDALADLPNRKAAVKSALRHVEADTEHPDWLRFRTTFETARGFGSYAVPADWAKTISLRVVTEDHHLDYIGAQALDTDYGSSGTSSGTPSAWHQEGGFLYLRPVPDAVMDIEHRYVRIETALTADADTPLLPARFHDAIVEKACAIISRRIGEYNRGIAHEKEYDEWLEKMRDEQTRVTIPPRIRLTR